MRRTTIYGRSPPPLDLHDPDQVRTADRRDVALALLRAGFGDAAKDVVFRRELVLRFVERIDGALRREVLRRLAEGFQALEIVGAVCEDVEQSSDELYFVTAMGRYLLNSSAPRDELMRRLPY
jgi:hypothetical protein